MATTIIRNGHKLCAKCERKGCHRYWGHEHDEAPNVVEPYASEEPCSCCEDDLIIDDGIDL